jgi:hypothetical protein
MVYRKHTQSEGEQRRGGRPLTAGGVTTMTTRRAHAKQSVDDEELSELTKVTISMQKGVLEDLRARARQRGVTITELIRRAVALEKMLFEDPEQEVLLRHQKTGKEVAIRVL